MRKSELKKEYYENILAKNLLTFQTVKSNQKNIDTYLTFKKMNSDIQESVSKEYNDVIEFITDFSIHERYTIFIIKSIASNSTHFCNKSCLDIVNSGYTQHILDDIKQEVFITLFDMIENNNVWLENNELVFNTYINSKDKKTSYFVKLYRTIENFFYSEKKQVESRYKKIKYYRYFFIR